MKIKAAVAYGPGEPLKVETVNLAPPKQGEVLIKMAATGVCHTDAYTLSGVDTEGIFPCVLGHEGGGIVESVGEAVSSLQAGDHVIPLYIPECGQCKYCQSNKTNLCQAVRETQGKGLMPDGTTRLSFDDGSPLYHYMGTSTFAEYAVIPEISLAKISKDAPLNRVCLLGCGITTGIGAVLNTAKVEQGATVAVFGLGGIGLSVIQGAKKAGASKIIAIDIADWKKDMALKLGATDFINPQVCTNSLKDTIIEMANGGVDYSFECIGNVELMREALECCHKGWGESIIVGVAGSGEEIATRPFQLVTGRVWRGTAFGGVKGRSELPKYVDEYLAGNINIDDFVTDTFNLDSINCAFDKMKQGESIRSVVEF